MLILIASGEEFANAWKKSGFSSRSEAEEALINLVSSLPPDHDICTPGRADRQGDKNSTGAVNSLKLVIFTDGASRGNPGPSSAAAIACLPSGDQLTSRAERIGMATNNVAEYESVILGLRLARDLGARDVVLKLDSELVVRQLNGEYKIKNSKLRGLADVVKREAEVFDSCTYVHIRRSDNAEADKLANSMLDEKGQS